MRVVTRAMSDVAAMAMLLRYGAVKSVDMLCYVMARYALEAKAPRARR